MNLKLRKHEYKTAATFKPYLELLWLPEQSPSHKMIETMRRVFYVYAE
jgi:hypothetical protein